MKHSKFICSNTSILFEGKFFYEQVAHGPSQSPEYQRLYTFLSEWLIFAYINKTLIKYKDN